MGNGAQIAGQATSAAATAGATAGSIFVAATAANAVPIAGQVASAALAIAGGLLMAFGGKRKAKNAAADARRKQEYQQRAAQTAPQAPQGVPQTIGGQQPQQNIQAVQQSPMPQAPRFDNYDNPAPAQTLYTGG